MKVVLAVFVLFAISANAVPSLINGNVATGTNTYLDPSFYNDQQGWFNLFGQDNSFGNLEFGSLNVVGDGNIFTDVVRNDGAVPSPYHSKILYTNLVGDDNLFAIGKLGGYNAIGDRNELLDITLLKSFNVLGDDNYLESFNGQNASLHFGNRLGDNNVVSGSELTNANAIGNDNDLKSADFFNANVVGDDNYVGYSRVSDGNHLGNNNFVNGSNLNFLNEVGDDNAIVFQDVIDYNAIGSNNYIDGGKWVSQNLVGDDNILGDVDLGDYNQLGDSNYVIFNTWADANAIGDVNDLRYVTWDSNNLIGDGNLGVYFFLDQANIVGDGNYMYGVAMNDENYIGSGNTLVYADFNKGNDLGDNDMVVGNHYPNYDTIQNDNVFGSFDFVDEYVQIGSGNTFGDFVFIGSGSSVGSDCDVADYAYICPDTDVPDETVIAEAEIYGTCACSDVFSCVQNGDGTATMGMTTFELVKGEFNWHSGNLVAANMQGHLATVHNPFENQCIADLLRANGIADNDPTLIGLHKPSSYVQFWDWPATGEELCYVNWDLFEPNNDAPGERCAVMYPGGGWNDEDCYGKRATYHIVVERSAYWPSEAKRQCGCLWDADTTCVAVDYSDAMDRAIFNGHQYFLVDQRLPFAAAQKAAAEMGGYLATVQSTAELEAIQNLILQKDAKASYWLGYARETQYDSFAWISGETDCVQDWDVNEPSLDADNCAVSYNDGWDNADCSSKRGFVVEIGPYFGDSLCEKCPA